ncbi:hypothetical protein [Myroides odoratus]|uniref:hypothetical protein n=1 Tax=Myroides odoratus TaxID=256 RepID=UPI0039B1040A
MLTSVTACTQEKTGHFSAVSSKTKQINRIPFFTKQQLFIYVDKETLEPFSNQKFKSASVYTPTGFAIVENEKGEYAVVDDQEKIVLDFSESILNLEVVQGLTFYRKDLEYEKKMPIWKWDWNLMGGGIKKEQTYHKIEIGVLETKQLLLERDLPYLNDNLYLNFSVVDDNHLFWEGTIYEIKKKRLYKVEQNIAELLDNNRFIKASGQVFQLCEMNQKKALHNALTGTDQISIEFEEGTLLLTEINKDRYAPEVPKLLLNTKTQDIYPFPNYDKAFPKKINQATASQIDFIKKTSLIYSIANSPYFLLGVFNYNHTIWAYDWLYIDTQGQVVDAIDTYNFKVVDQVGNLVWPDRKMILPDQFIADTWKIGKINSYTGMQDVYFIRIEDENQKTKMGLWNSKTKRWEIKPEYYAISVLDAEKQLYALQKEEEGLYQLYDNASQKNIGLHVYQAINSDGLVRVKQSEETAIYYYIDIYSGKEYKE